MKTILKLSIFCLILFSLRSFAQDKTEEIQAKIEQTFVEGILNLQASASNQTTAYQELDYLFVAIKKGSSGNLSNNKQSGKFTLNPNETKKLSEININIQPKDALKVFLYIKDEQSQKLIAKDSLEINPKNFDKKLGKVDETDLFELKGLTIDDTKTKIGKDFYDLFYLTYSQLPEKYSNSITISELPNSGRGSQISIVLEDRTLYSFISSPNEDYLSEQANYSMKIIADYNQKKSLIKNEFKY